MKATQTTLEQGNYLMKETLNQLQIVFTVAIANTLFSTTAIAQPYPPLNSKPHLAAVSGQAYTFTMTLPKRSSNYKKLSFSLMNLDRQSIVPLPLNLKNTVVRTKNAIALKSTFIDETGTLWVEFNSSIPANTPLTVTFKAQEPLLAGQYQYQIAAYPTSGASAEFVKDGTFVSR
ncbi:DUF2808 domain-containing protein [Leptolyngbya sp. NIES-2104]|uniref:DUF2808 domain-containing protein n=1 Tax=Leptolyngbya sp. NIES-2104 TaxID=1552121 RepID=UPI0006EC439A|nr:DUF2808 domain-containing protein [Leptolyngbya sp. NIES-2104]GAP95527.1 hypothetical protein NIES2104_20490 [Leptolyngbya sp. NIES-2104]